MCTILVYTNVNIYENVPYMVSVVVNQKLLPSALLASTNVSSNLQNLQLKKCCFFIFSSTIVFDVLKARREASF